MDIIDLLKTKLRNDLLEELSEYDIEDLETQIDDKVTDDLFVNDDKEKINDIPDENRCCARIMGERYSDERCPYRKVKDDYCKIHKSEHFDHLKQFKLKELEKKNKTIKNIPKSSKKYKK